MKYVDDVGMYGTAPSLPSRERGLKLLMVLNVSSPLCVAPLAGAWIEIQGVEYAKQFVDVAPLAGAWIEI